MLLLFVLKHSTACKYWRYDCTNVLYLARAYKATVSRSQ